MKPNPEQPPLDYPCLLLRDWAEFLLKMNCWHVLCGLLAPDSKRERAIWTEFWARYRKVEPLHPIFRLADEGKIDLSRTAAMLLHGDEGRGRRRSPFLVVSYHSILGRGTVAANRKRVQKPYLKMRTNFGGHSFTSRFLCGVLPRDAYAQNEECFQSLLQVASQEAAFMFESGVEDRYGHRHYMALLKNTGDWPWHHKSGGLTRSFNNSQKKATLKNPPAGICHLCQAGQLEFPMEQFSAMSPTWLTTMFKQSPFLAEPALAAVPHPEGKLESLWAFDSFDLFHCWNLGVGKNYLGSILALMSERENGGNIDLRFDMLSSRYRMWCKETRRTPFISRITKDTICWSSKVDFPTGSWFKAALTNVLMDFVQERAETEDFRDDPILHTALEGGKAMLQALRLLYEADCWLEADEAKRIAGLGLKFLKRYAQAASLSYRDGKALFVLMPKMYAVQHIWLQLWAEGCEGGYCLNPITTSVAHDEDFISRPSRLSRRVASVTVIRRTIERYLQSAYAAWIEAGLLTPSS